MLILFYNILLTVALIVVGPLLTVKAILTAKYRRRLPQRLGVGLTRAVAGCRRSGPRIWIHALSVGEVASARALVKAIRADLPGAAIVFSTTTSAGSVLASTALGEEVDLLLPFPLDIRPVVSRFLSLVRPDLFILVETDFWPNVLQGLRKRGVPAVLVNGRISRRSFRSYRRARFLFRPLFDSFAAICMQTGEDVERMKALGVPAAKVMALGNLKYESVLPAGSAAPVEPQRYGIAADRRLWVAGSTHDGEHELALQVHRRLLQDFPDLLLVLAPRQVDRGERLAASAVAAGLDAVRRSEGNGAGEAAVLILDTIGELAEIYRFCAVAFVGGSLVAEGGHNPLEPAAFARPVLFGPHMDDFREVSRDLLEAHGAMQVADEEELLARLRLLLDDEGLCQRTGAKGAAFVKEQQGVTVRHLEMVKKMLAVKEKGGPDGQ